MGHVYNRTLDKPQASFSVDGAILASQNHGDLGWKFN